MNPFKSRSNHCAKKQHYEIHRHAFLRSSMSFVTSSESKHHNAEMYICIRTCACDSTFFSSIKNGIVIIK